MFRPISLINALNKKDKSKCWICFITCHGKIVFPQQINDQVKTDVDDEDLISILEEHYLGYNADLQKWILVFYSPTSSLEASKTIEESFKHVEMQRLLIVNKNFETRMYVESFSKLIGEDDVST